MFRIQHFVLFALVAVICVSARIREKLRLSVYYESKGDSSKTFILNQLVPAMRILVDHVSIQFVPFGNATIEKHNEFINCPRGRMECTGNVIQDCAFYIGGPGLPDATKLEYVNCEMTTHSATKSDMSCVKKAGISVAEVGNCAFTYFGRDIQRSSKYLTDIVNLKGFPSIAINEEYDQKVQDEGMVNLLGMLCSKLQYTTGCAQYFNKLALQEIHKLNPIDTQRNLQTATAKAVETSISHARAQ